MADKTPELVGKKKLVVDSDAFFSAPRKENNELTDALQDTINNGAYFKSFSDKVRVVSGRNWDFRAQGEPNQKIFSNEWAPPIVFKNDKITLDPCANTSDEVNAGTFDQRREEKFILKNSTPQDENEGNNAAGRIISWAMYTKTGIVDKQTNTEYNPIILTNKIFLDHHHESINPFTPADLDKKQPAGKAFFANYKTYYNERLDSGNFESATGNLILPGSSAPFIQNALPSIYGFLRLFTNKFVMEDDAFKLNNIRGYLEKFFNLQTSVVDQQNIYRTVLRNYPLESLLTMYGTIGHLEVNPLAGTTAAFKNFEKSKIIEKIISTSFDNIDADSLFSDYFNEFAAILAGGSGGLVNSSYSTNRYSSPFRALERIMTNLVFSPNALKTLNKVDQYKKYFPFYAELEFTARLDTELGDAMKKMYLTKFLSEQILTSLKPPVNGDGAQSYSNSWKNMDTANFVMYSQETLFNDLSTTADDEVSNPQMTSVSDVKFINLPETFQKWLTEDNGSYNGVQEPATATNFNPGDLRNYVSFFRNDFSEPPNIDSDENVIFKKLFGSAFLAKLLDVYNNTKRTYKEIIDGKPAYTEDLFYRIEKIRKIANSENEEVVQNILIPNTSQLDIVKYVDTQLKYATYATYKYNVYAHRAVFGSKYEYQWLDGLGGVVAPPNKRDLQTVTFPPGVADPNSSVNTIEYVDLGGPLGSQFGVSETKIDGTHQLHSTFNTVVRPSIILLEDKIFSTPDILILDKPPVIPDVNIIPYRAVNNRIKILITGASDRYRAKPVILLPSDVEEFDKIKRAQLVVDNSGNPLEDGKVEFGSDDPVGTFQIFRTQEKPSTYQDFSLYQQINEYFFEEQVVPNTKYYYTFRAIDDHGHVSNPTPVYEVELIDEKGAVKPIIRLFDMTPPKNKTNIKGCQKYIYLKPALQQLYFSDDASIDGIFSNLIKKKRYKMRLTSKGTGKKIDINFSFIKESKN